MAGVVLGRDVARVRGAGEVEEDVGEEDGEGGRRAVCGAEVRPGRGEEEGFRREEDDDEEDLRKKRGQALSISVSEKSSTHTLGREWCGSQKGEGGIKLTTVVGCLSYIMAWKNRCALLTTLPPVTLRSSAHRAFGI